jgi:hypothetical protein
MMIFNQTPSILNPLYGKFNTHNILSGTQLIKKGSAESKNNKYVANTASH